MAKKTNDQYKKLDEQIRVHNKGKRTIDYRTEKGGKVKYMLPGRAVTLSKETAEKYLKAYPRDLIEFDSLITGEKKNLSRENVRLESENEKLREKIAKLESGKVSELDKPSTKKEDEPATKQD